MKKVLVVLIVAIVPLLFAKVVLAEGPNLKPGKWEFKTTSIIPMMPDPQIMTNTKCITAEDASRDPLAAMVEEGKCRVLNKEENGNTIEFEVECDGDLDMKMRGNGHFTADGTTASGKMVMTMDMPQMGGQNMMSGQSMKITHEWEGKRTGDCD